MELKDQMKQSEYILKSLASAVGTFAYIAAVAWLGFNSQTIFGKVDGFLAPLFALLLFVVSACITGALVLGKPIQLYLSGLKREGIVLFAATVAWLVLFLMAIIIVLLVR